MPRGRVAVIGDIGGHQDQLLAALRKLGMNDADVLPDDLTVVQVGDLINRGPDTPGVLRLVAAIIDRQPDQWVQLAGNHEGLHLPDAPQFRWPESLAVHDAELLRSWWSRGSMRVAAGLDTDFGPVLVTHAGLTSGMWEILGTPDDVREAAARLNELPVKNPRAVFRTGLMMDGSAPNAFAGPLWAEAGRELYPSWRLLAQQGVSVPFGQVHGHSTAYMWSRRVWTGDPACAPMFTLAQRARHVVGIIDSRLFAGIDPCFGRRPFTGSWEPMVFRNARVVAR